MPFLLLTLAKQVDVGKMLTWTGVALVAVIGASLAVLAYRRRVLGPPQMSDQGGLMDELRDMKKRGELSEEEYAAAKLAMVARLSGSSNARPKAPAPRSGELIAPPGVDLTGQPLPKPPRQPPGV